jgi:hypothetical protein
MVPIARPALQGPGNEPLVVADVSIVQAVNVSGIDQRDAGIEHGVQDTNGLFFGGAILD